MGLQGGEAALSEQLNVGHLTTSVLQLEESAFG
jgi:hypothetical protein